MDLWLWSFAIGTHNSITSHVTSFPQTNSSYFRDANTAMKRSLMHHLLSDGFLCEPPDTSFLHTVREAPQSPRCWRGRGWMMSFLFLFSCKLWILITNEKCITGRSVKYECVFLGFKMSHEPRHQGPPRPQRSLQRAKWDSKQDQVTMTTQNMNQRRLAQLPKDIRDGFVMRTQ